MGADESKSVSWARTSFAVEVHQAELPSSDIAFGLALNATRTFTNFPSVPIVLNEVLANNATVAHSGETNITDWVELHNLSTNRSTFPT
jgi:hypothetical protein